MVKEATPADILRMSRTLFENSDRIKVSHKKFEKTSKKYVELRRERQKTVQRRPKPPPVDREENNDTTREEVIVEEVVHHIAALKDASHLIKSVKDKLKKVVRVIQADEAFTEIINDEEKIRLKRMKKKAKEEKLMWEKALLASISSEQFILKCQKSLEGLTTVEALLRGLLTPDKLRPIYASAQVLIRKDEERREQREAAARKKLFRYR